MMILDLGVASTEPTSASGNRKVPGHPVITTGATAALINANGAGAPRFGYATSRPARGGAEVMPPLPDRAGGREVLCSSDGSRAGSGRSRWAVKARGHWLSAQDAIERPYL